MSNVGPSEYGSIVQKISVWPAELKLALADELIHSCRQDEANRPMRGVSPNELWRMLAAVGGEGRPANDEDTRILEDELVKKYLQ